MFADTTHKRFVAFMLSGCLVALVTGILVWKWEFKINPSPTADAGPPTPVSTAPSRPSATSGPTTTNATADGATVGSASDAHSGTTSMATRTPHPTQIGAPFASTPTLVEGGHLPLAGAPGLPLVITSPTNLPSEAPKGTSGADDGRHDEGTDVPETSPAPTGGSSPGSEVKTPAPTTDPSHGSQTSGSGDPVPADPPSPQAGPISGTSPADSSAQGVTGSGFDAGATSTSAAGVAAVPAEPTPAEPEGVISGAITSVISEPIAPLVVPPTDPLPMDADTLPSPDPSTPDPDSAR